MTTRYPHPLDRRTLIARGAAAAVFAGLLRQQAFARQASPSPATSSEGIAELVAGNTAFAFDLYRQYRDVVDGNIVFSPYSVSLAMAMVFAGARGDTAEQMADVLGFAQPDVAIHDAFASLTSDLASRTGGELRIANALWGDRSFSFDASFMQEMESTYGAEVQSVDFLNAPEAARDEINSWVAGETDDHITEIVPEGVITALTRLVLANAVYFSSKWVSEFDSKDTEDGPFYLLDGTTVDVPFMSKSSYVPYVQENGIQAIELPYMIDGFTMTVVLPDEGWDEELDGDAFRKILDSMTSTTIRVDLPSITFNVARSLVDMLAALGMTDVFDPDLSDLSGMIDPIDPGLNEGLMVSDVLHEATIDVTEAGTEATAATTVVVGPTSAPAPPEGSIVFRADHPFHFAIRDTVTGTVLFLGQVLDPSGA
ncbi:MAG TPA: serpin family protein [Thermomicrobiales bacterium]|nr:serpin family protein [Thermomicrobiales bacterium]